MDRAVATLQTFREGRSLRGLHEAGGGRGMVWGQGMKAESYRERRPEKHVVSEKEVCVRERGAEKDTTSQQGREGKEALGGREREGREGKESGHGGGMGGMPKDGCPAGKNWKLSIRYVCALYVRAVWACLM